MLGLSQDQAAARAAQGLVGGGGDEVRNTNRAGVIPRRHQPRVVRHVHEQVGAHAVGDRAEALPVDHQRIGGSACHDHLRLVLVGQFLHRVVVDLFLVVQAVGDGVVQLAADIHRRAMGEVAAMCQTHAQNGVARLQHRCIHRLVGLRTGMRLHVGVFRAEQRLGAVYRQLLGDVHELAAAVIALARIALGILVGELAALRLHHRRAGVVFRGDQLDVIFLAAVFILDRCPQVRVNDGDGVFSREHGSLPKAIRVNKARILPCGRDVPVGQPQTAGTGLSGAPASLAA